MTIEAELEEASDSDSRLRLALAFGDLAVWEMDLDRNEITRSPELNRLYGFPADARPTGAEYVARHAPGEAARVGTLPAADFTSGQTTAAPEPKYFPPEGTG